MAEGIAKGMSPLLCLRSLESVLLRNKPLQPPHDPPRHLGEDGKGDEDPQDFDPGGGQPSGDGLKELGHGRFLKAMPNIEIHEMPKIRPLDLGT